MIHEQRIEIGLNKKKLKNGVITCISLGFLGLMIFIWSINNKYPIFNSQFVKYGAAVISICSFGFGTFYFLRKLIDKKPGILIDDKGILDNSSPVCVGLINWHDIKQFATATAMKQEFLIVEVNNPEYYINKQTNYLMKKGMASNYKHFGSPLAISASLLNCNLSELMAILEKRLSSRHE